MRLPLILPALLGSCGTGAPDASAFKRSLDSVFATLADRAGDVQARQGDDLAWRDVGIGVTFVPRDWLKTGRASLARVELLEGGRLELESHALVLLERPEADSAEPGAPRPVAMLDVGAGSLGGVLAKKKSVDIRSDDGERARLTAVSDTPVEYRVERSQRGTEVAVRKGEAVLRLRGADQPMTAGQVERIARSSAPRLAGPITLPPPPALLAPADGAQLPLAAQLPMVLPLRWSPAGAAYRVQVSTEPSFRQSAVDLVVSQPTVEAELPGEGEYFWRVASLDAEGRQGELSAPHRFEVGPPLPDDLLIAPLDGEELKVQPRAEIVLRWQAAKAANGYRVVLSRHETLSDAITEVLTRETRHALTSPGPGTYWWGVYDEAGRPLFLRPRKLVLRNAGKELKFPPKLQQWGE